MTIKSNLREDVVAKGAEIGQGAYATAKDAVAIGTLNAAAGSDPETEGAFATAVGAVQIGPGTNAVAGTIKVGATIVAVPILTGTATPVEAVVPVAIGQVFVDTTAKKVYVAVGLTHADWAEMAVPTP